MEEFQIFISLSCANRILDSSQHATLSKVGVGKSGLPNSPSQSEGGLLLGFTVNFFANPGYHVQIHLVLNGRSSPAGCARSTRTLD